MRASRPKNAPEVVSGRHSIDRQCDNYLPLLLATVRLRFVDVRALTTRSTELRITVRYYRAIFHRGGSYPLSERQVEILGALCMNRAATDSDFGNFAQPPGLVVVDEH